jgi:hypothetical protein
LFLILSVNQYFAFVRADGMILQPQRQAFFVVGKQLTHPNNAGWTNAE